jgi:hypothetical protein
MPAQFPPDESPFKGLPDDRCQCDEICPVEERDRTMATVASNMGLVAS